MICGIALVPGTTIEHNPHSTFIDVSYDLVLVPPKSMPFMQIRLYCFYSLTSPPLYCTGLMISGPCCRLHTARTRIEGLGSNPRIRLFSGAGRKVAGQVYLQQESSRQLSKQVCLLLVRYSPHPNVLSSIRLTTALFIPRLGTGTNS